MECNKGEVKASSKLGDFLREFIFQQDEVEKPDSDLSNPSEFSVPDGIDVENINLCSGDGHVGVWYMKPKERDIKETILYLHGVKGNRGRSYRVGLYKVLIKLGYSVLAVDYRGFGDSSDTSEDEDTVVEDSQTALKWLLSSLPAEYRIIVWGHSMGTAIAVHTLALQFRNHKDSPRIKGLILESPFNNFTEEFIEKTSNSSNPLVAAALSGLYAVTGDTIPETLLRRFNMEFNSDEHVADINCPIMILHAEDDDKVPIELGFKLYEAAKKKHKKDVIFKSFPHNLNLGHHDIYQAENLPSLVQHFITSL